MNLTVMDNKTWYVLGAGSIGCLWTASLCQKKVPVRLLVRDETYYNLREPQQVELKFSYQNSRDHFSVPIACSAELNEPVSRLIVCTKAQDSLSAIRSIAHNLTSDCKILLLQNGMGSQQTVAYEFPDLAVWAGSATDGAYLNKPFDVCHAGQGMTQIGPLGKSWSSNDFALLQDDFHLVVHQVEDIEQVLWKKFAINCCINGLTALYDCRNGKLLDNGEKQQWLDQLAIEVNRVLEIVARPIKNLIESAHHICQITGNNISSTCQDARHGRRTELAYLNHYLVEQSEFLQIPVPSHQKLLAALEKKGIR